MEDENNKIFRSKVFELDDEFIVNESPLNIIISSCLFFGSSFEGRREGTKSLLDCDIKVPIIVEESKNLIFFPTNSYKSCKNIWVSYNNLLIHKKYSFDTTLFSFAGNNNIKVNVKFNIVDNQIIRCIKLNAILSKRKLIKCGE